VPKKSSRISKNQVVTTHSSIRMASPESKNRSPRSLKPNLTTPEVAKGFVSFLKDHAVVGLAVGFVIATQVQALVKLLVNGFITPTFQFFFKNALVKDQFVVHVNGALIVYPWGQFANGFLDFIFVLIAIYLIIRIFRLDKFNKPKA
jgi:large-conductance mechanosensitive channel